MLKIKKSGGGRDRMPLPLDTIPVSSTDTPLLIGLSTGSRGLPPVVGTATPRRALGSSRAARSWRSGAVLPHAQEDRMHKYCFRFLARPPRLSHSTQRGAASANQPAGATGTACKPRQESVVFLPTGCTLGQFNVLRRTSARRWGPKKKEPLLQCSGLLPVLVHSA